MHSIIEKLLRQRKIDSVDQLRDDEKETFDKWERILSEGEMSLEKITKFCEAQLNIIDDQFKKFDNSKEKNERLIICRTVYKSLRDAINSPMAERESLEKYLNSLL